MFCGTTSCYRVTSFFITNPKSGGKEPQPSKASGGMDIRTDYWQLVYAWVKDGKGHAASANQPFEVR